MEGENAQFQDSCRRSTLDPSTVNAMCDASPDTPYSRILRINQMYDTGAKIVDAIKQGIEMKTGDYLSDEEIYRIVDTLLSRDVYSFFICY